MSQSKIKHRTKPRSHENKISRSDRYVYGCVEPLSLSAAKPSAAERQQAAATMKALAESRDYTVKAQAFPLKGQRGYSFGYPQDQRE